MTTGADWDAHYAGGAGRRHWPHNELVAFVAGQAATGHRFSRILDAGCGNGANLRLWGTDVYSVGLDGHWPVLDEACALQLRGSVVRGDVRHLPFADGAFDLVVDCLTSQHLRWEQHKPLFEEYRRVLQAGDWLWLCHLSHYTKSARGEHLGFFDYAGLALFPAVPLFCLPPPGRLASEVRAAGFWRPEVRTLARTYPDGKVAHYAIVAARAR